MMQHYNLYYILKEERDKRILPSQLHENLRRMGFALTIGFDNDTILKTEKESGFMEHNYNQLVISAQGGDSQATAKLLEESYQDIHYFILKTVKGQELAEDLTQDTCLRIIERLNELQNPEAFVSWSRQIAYHCCTDYFRKRKEFLLDEFEDGSTVLDTLPEEDVEFIPHEALAREDLKNTLLQMLDALPQEQRTAMILRYYDELSVSQIAEVQKVSQGTVKSRLNYGRKTLAKSVEAYEKKNNIKLHSISVLPLLLWLFRKQKLEKGESFTAVATGSATSAVSAGAEVAVSGIKSFFGSLAGKVTAAVLAVSLLGGIAATCIPKDEPNQAVDGNVSNSSGSTVENVQEQPDGLVDYWLITSYNTVDVEYDEEYNVRSLSDGYGYIRTYTYNEKNQVVTQTLTRRDNSVLVTKTYTYDAQGNMVHCDKQSFGYVDYEYENGNRVKTTWSETNGEVSQWIDAEYDNEGRMIASTTNYNDKENTIADATYTYNEEGQLVLESHYSRKDGRLLNSTTYYYENGLLMEKKNGKSVINYEYDDNGNLLFRLKENIPLSRFSYTKVRITPEQAQRLTSRWSEDGIYREIGY